MSPRRVCKIQPILARLGMTEKSVPTADKMFRRQKENSFKTVSLQELAIFNDPLTWEGEGTVGKAVRSDVADRATACNLLNPFAEVNARQVEAVLRRLLQDGELFFPIQVARLTDVPEHLKSRFRPDTYQVISGRNRVAALALLYRSDIKIPVIITTETYTTAQRMAREANEHRFVTVAERQFTAGLNLVRHSAVPSEQFSRLARKPSKIADWMLHHSYFAPVADLNILPRISAPFLVNRPKKKFGMGYMAAELRNFMTPSVELLVRDYPGQFSSLDTALPMVSKLVEIIDSFTFSYASYATACSPTGTPMGNYLSELVGKEIRNDLNKHMSQKTPVVPAELGAAVAARILEFLTNRNLLGTIRSLRGNAIIEEFNVHTGGSDRLSVFNN